ncbi:Golgi integral membrane protein 4a isoform X2 [Megalops cyprinoides]|uniref:Golgi integral membrane protein 4a isoform X2 n=1 Tax=Megalops cyprinoides TaxID=118141 RepID=UPI0018648EE7|nr:Golgi integral membrane protein 4a isoform X2 [Megalops cyprinoides]
MGNGMCSRRQKKIFQSLLLFTVSLGLIYGGIVSYEMHKQLKKTEAMALKYQQHQESLSAQLQVVYEHRSRLEKSLQKERLEHKKAKEDYLMHKLEAQQILNKEKQDSSNRFNSLHVQHQMLKGQHEELKKQIYDLQEQHQIQVEDHSRVIEEHRQKYDQLRQTKEREISKLEENVYNLQEENKQLRKAHQDVHKQLQDAQGQIEEFKQLKETLNRMSSLQQVNAKPTVAPAQAAALRADSSHNQPDHKEAQSRVEQGEGHRKDAGEGKQQLAVSRRVVQPEGEAGPGAGEEEGGERGGAREEQQRKEMEQAGQPQHLEEPEQPREEEEEVKEPEQNQPDENTLDRNRHQAAPPLVPELQPDAEQQAAAQAEPVKSAYQQQEQQHAAVQLAEERRQAHLREQLLRQGNQFDMDSAIVQGEEDSPNKQGEEGNIQTQLEEEEGEQAEGDRGRNREDNLAEEDVNPEDDPNNQGEDEFDEAQEQGAGAPVGQSQHQAGENQNQPAAAERDDRGMGGNPDQQEDTLDEQYQEEGEEEVQDLRVHQRQEEEVVKETEAPYNDENREYALMRQDNMKRQEGPEKEDNAARKEGAANEQGNYEEEEAEVLEDEEGAQDKPANRRAEI